MRLMRYRAAFLRFLKLRIRWIIQDILSGSIRVWDRTSDELFFGKEKDIVYEKTDEGEYLKVAV